jgi:hypothetical protein
MAEHRAGERTNIVMSRVSATLPERARFCADDERLRGTCACAPIDPVSYERRRARTSGARGGGETNGEANHILRDWNSADERLECEHVFTCKHGLEGHRRVCGGLLNDRDFVGFR